MTIPRALCAATFAGVAALAVAAPASADRAEPVPLFGTYDTFLDHSQQTFNGRPDTSDPSTQGASFTTTCVASGCVAHWLRLTELTENQMHQHFSTMCGPEPDGSPPRSIRSTATTAARSRPPDQTSWCPTTTEASPASGLSPLAGQAVPATARVPTGCRSR
jgi:hypothetical protein